MVQWIEPFRKEIPEVPWTIDCSDPEDFALRREDLRLWLRLSLGPRGETFFVAINEGVSNAFRHGTLPGEPPWVALALTEEGPGVVATIQDRGPGLPPGALQRDFPDLDSEGGRGLPLMVMLADEVSYDAATRTLRLVARRPSLSPAGDDMS